MTIDEANIDCEEDGFRLVLTGDFVEAFADYLAADPASRDSCTVRLRLSQDAALELAGSARATIIDWADEHDAALAEYRRASPAERIAVPGVRSIVRDHAAGVDPDEQMREAADDARKAARERA